MPAVLVLIVAGIHEGDVLRADLLTGGCQAESVTSLGAAGIWLASRQADAVVFATGSAAGDPAAALRKLRGLIGGDRRLLCVCEAQEQPGVTGLADAVLPRPLAPGAVVTQVLALSVADIDIDAAVESELFAPTAHRTSELPREVVDSLLADSLTAGASSDVVTADATPTVGDLADQDLPLLLGRLFVEGATGRLTLRHGGVDKAIYFEAGRPVLATSTDVADRMIEMLLREGKLGPEQHAEALRAAADTGRRMGALLIDLGIMKGSELLPAVRQHYEGIVLSLFAWTRGQWQLEPGVIADPRRVRLLRHPAALVDEGLRRGFSADRVRARLGSAQNVFRLDTHGGASDVLLEIGRDVAEKRVSLLFDGARSLQEVIRASRAPEETVLRLSLALSVFQVLVAVSPGHANERGQPRDRQIARDRIIARYARVVEGDYFQVLGVPRDASAQEVRRAHESLGRDLAVEATGPALASELAAEIAAIRVVMDEGLRVLSSDRTRSSYQASLPPVTVGT